ncbi:general stress protein [Georgenia sp. AZ-5]|uniref:general stress protein n=1 Tax=Georgenia sp. AZ-5 TaxID=3367526 RepID=UPI003754BF96
MAMVRKQNDTSVPTMPTGVEVASFATYLEAQKAVDHLSDEAFPVRNVTIVGSDLRLVERITGRLTYARVAGAGAMSGAWFGLMISLLFWLLTPSGEFPLLAGVLIGAAFGILFAIVSYAFTGGKRDFTSASQVVASRYTILCAPESAGEARRLLSDAGQRGWAPPSGRPATTPPAAPYNPYGTPRPADPGAAQPGAAEPGATQPGGPAGAGQPGQPGQPETASRPAPAAERPRYGLRLEDLEQAGPAGPAAPGAPAGAGPAGAPGGGGPTHEAAGEDPGARGAGEPGTDDRGPGRA